MTSERSAASCDEQHGAAVHECTRGSFAPSRLSPEDDCTEYRPSFVRLERPRWSADDVPEFESPTRIYKRWRLGSIVATTASNDLQAAPLIQKLPCCASHTKRFTYAARAHSTSFGMHIESAAFGFVRCVVSLFHSSVSSTFGFDRSQPVIACRFVNRVVSASDSGRYSVCSTCITALGLSGRHATRH